MRGIFGDFDNLLSTSRLAALVLPAILVVVGVSIIWRQTWPTMLQQIEEVVGGLNVNTVALVSEDYLATEATYSNPGARYFQELKNESQDLLFKDQKSAGFQGTFSLSIPSLELYDLKVNANVDSSVEEVYDQFLEDGLAHFAGTNLPFSEENTSNTVIYGHSSPGDYYERTKDPAAAFSRLSQIRYGSEIIVNFEGEEYRYKFIKGKIVGADDLSILQGSRGQEQLTLFTCYPNGNNGKRFVATARLIED